MSVKLLTEHHWEFLRLKEAAQARLSLHLSKYHIVGNHMSWLIYIRNLMSYNITFQWLAGGFTQLAVAGYSNIIIQWLIGRVLDLRPRGRRFEPHRRHCVVPLSKNINPSLVLVQPRKTVPL